MQTMMDKVDDALFDLADKAENNTIQSMYFEAMREVRLKRSQVETQFNAHFIDAANKELGRHARPTFDPPPSAAEGELVLVANDDLEESLAVTNMAAKIRAACKDELFALEQRIGLLLEDPELDGTSNPIGPEIVCRAAKEACAVIESGLKIRLIILKLFDRFVAADVVRIYPQINEFLVASGVAPQLRQTPRKQTSPRRSGPATVSTGHDVMPTEHGGRSVESPGEGLHGALQPAALAVADGTGLLGALQQLMSASRISGSAYPGMEAVGDPSLIQDLTLLQRGDADSIAAGEAPLAIGSLSSVINVLHDLKGSSVARSSGTVDDSLIDIVAMMFDYILDDTSLPDTIKALIGRLQIPILKVAILDKSFFSRKFHPARKLLNTLAEAAVGWNEEHDQHDSFFNTVEKTVNRIVREFNEDVSIFSKVLAEFESFLENEAKRAAQQAQELTQAAATREQLKLAKERACDVIQQRMDSAHLPATVTHFLKDYWQALLTLVRMKSDENSAEWKNAIATMDELIWSVTPKESVEERQRLLQGLPQLLKRLNQGIERVSIPDSYRERLMSDLAARHAEVVRGYSPDRPPEQETRPSTTPAGGAPSVVQPLCNEQLPGSGEHEASFSEKARDVLSEQGKELVRAFDKANATVIYSAHKRPACQGMGTTLTAIWLHDNRMTLAHVGDSRSYRLRDSLQQLTVDHSLQQEMVDKGFFTPKEAKTAVNGNIVTRAIGAEASLETDVWEDDVLPGDLYLLCSDGLSDLVACDEIQAVLVRDAENLNQAAQRLIQMANDAGGKDNISVILVRAGGSASEHPTPGGATVEGKVEFASGSDVGKRRSHNEDSLGLDPALGLAVLADGMGGCNAGEVASRLAVNTVLNAVRAAAAAQIQAEQSASPPVSDANDVPFDAASAMASSPEEEPYQEVEEIVIEDVLGADVTLPEDDDYTRVVQQLAVGSWVEFRRDNMTRTRARLTWISPVTNAYLFTNRQGLKVADSTPRGLAVELRRGTVVILDGVPLFDRAVTNLMDRLRTPSPE
jgi:serine/threonine protein phosphatase PrpC